MSLNVDSSSAKNASILLGMFAAFALGYSVASRNTKQGEISGLKFSKEELVKDRKCARSQRLSHSHNPLIAMRGEGAYLFDENGNAFLDARNNVASIGHQQPDWVKAVSNQIAQTNTNARYLHPLRHQLVQELSETLPKELEMCFLLNSGSEATELALRIAKSYSKCSTVLAVEMGYHGVTNAALNASPYKWQTFDPPDSLRVIKLGQDVTDFTSNCKIGCFITESALSVAGVKFPPTGWLSRVVDGIRAQGGVSIFDEVQVGLGRTGTFWAFEQENCVPDIVTMGKGLGNGFPIGAVFCRKEVADALDAEGREVFSTFGGNPAACAAALTVLSIIRSENLMDNSMQTGAYLMKRLEILSHPGIVDIRGRGLFVGIEFTDGIVASRVGKRMFDTYRVLTSFDGPQDRVMVIKPPLIWSKSHVDEFIRALAESLDYLDKDDEVK